MENIAAYMQQSKRHKFDYLLQPVAFSELCILCQYSYVVASVNDLSVIAETEDDLIKRLDEWKDHMKCRGMRVNMNKTKVITSGERQKVRQKAVRWPCRVCSRGVGSNSITVY